MKLYHIFSATLALWVMWGLLCGHLVAFKAPKSWPNKFLINVWGGFSVIFIASYTANIAALIAGLFFLNAANTHDASVSWKAGMVHELAFGFYQQIIIHSWWHNALGFHARRLRSLTFKRMTSTCGKGWRSTRLEASRREFMGWSEFN